MNKTLRLGFAMLTAAVLGAAAKQASAGNDVLVMPARQRMVALAFDVQSLRDVVMITYRGNAGTKTPLLHTWDPRGSEWKEITPEEYAVGQFMSSPPDTIYLIGTEADIPAAVQDGAAQARKVVRIDTMNIAEVVNSLNQTMNFSSREWKALEERHGLQTRDLNYERRKWGRFGPPPGAVKATVNPEPDAELPATEGESDPDTVAQEPAEVTVPAAEENAAAPVLDDHASQPLAPEGARSPQTSPAPVEEKGMPDAGTVESAPVTPDAVDRPEDK